MTLLLQSCRVEDKGYFAAAHSRYIRNSGLCFFSIHYCPDTIVVQICGGRVDQHHRSPKRIIPRRTCFDYRYRGISGIQLYCLWRKQETGRNLSGRTNIDLIQPFSEHYRNIEPAGTVRISRMWRSVKEKTCVAPDIQQGSFVSVRNIRQIKISSASSEACIPGGSPRMKTLQAVSLQRLPDNIFSFRIDAEYCSILRLLQLMVVQLPGQRIQIQCFAAILGANRCL